MGSQDAVQLRSKSLDRTAARLIHKMCAELDRNAPEAVEGVRQQE
jgi:hypothetical protein